MSVYLSKLSVYLFIIYFKPFDKNEHQLPHSSTLHVVEVDEEETQPHPRGDVALQHDHTKQDAPEHGAQFCRT